VVGPYQQFLTTLGVITLTALGVAPEKALLFGKSSICQTLREDLAPRPLGKFIHESICAASTLANVLGVVYTIRAGAKFGPDRATGKDHRTGPFAHIGEVWT
jgi:hypothetical protein